MNVRKSKSLDMIYIALGAVFITISSWITIPLAIPVTLQTCGIFIITGVFGGRIGTLSVAVYIMLGIAGFPVFSGFRGGIGMLFGNTGGYIIGFLFAVLLFWGLENKIAGHKKEKLAVMICGQAICYLFGTLWYGWLYLNEWSLEGVGLILGWCVFPFLIPDICKIGIALMISEKLKKIVK